MYKLYRYEVKLTHAKSTMPRKHRGQMERNLHTFLCIALNILKKIINALGKTQREHTLWVCTVRKTQKQED
jgi:hypothetical protein